MHSYFVRVGKAFGPHFEDIYANFVFHTDLVKCGSRDFGNKETKAVKNCTDYLERQLKVFKPKIVICNGVSVVDRIQNILVAELEVDD